MHHYSYPAEKWDEEHLDKAIILTLIREHEGYSRKKFRNMEYYLGHHAVEKKKRTDENAPNAQVVCNHAKDIAETATGYFMGNPITYSNTGDQDIEHLLEVFDFAEVDDVDYDNALEMSIFGSSYEYVYVKEGTNEVHSKNVSALNTFIIVDDTIEQNELCGVYYYKKVNDVAKTAQYVATVGTKNYIYNIVVESSDSGEMSNFIEDKVQHYFGDIPFIEYLNNKHGIGDFEQQISLIDAYNTLMSDRVVDKEQFIDAILVIYGALLGEDEESTDEALDKLHKKKLLEMSSDARAEYLTRQMDENGVEVLRKSIKEDIYNFSHVPNFMDENFAGNTSGVAMEYKLLGLEMLTKTKERYYRKGLRRRISLYCTYPENHLTQLLPEANFIIPDFSRALPKNLQELSQVITNLTNLVSNETLLKQIPFVEDVEFEQEAVEEQKKQALEDQQGFFGLRPNTPPEEPEDGSEDRTEDDKER